MACCFASRPATIPAAFFQSAFNGPQPTCTAAVSVGFPASVFHTRVVDLWLVGGRGHSAANRSDRLLSQQKAGFLSRIRDDGWIQFAQRLLCLRTRRSGTAAYLHDAIPVVARGDLKQGEEGHAEVLEGGVTTHTLAGVVCIANWGPERRKADRGEEKKMRGGLA